MASRKEQKAAARERLRQEMEQRKRRARRNRVIGVTAGVVVLVVAAVSIAVAVQFNRDKNDRLAAGNKKAIPTKLAKDGLAIPVGKSSAPVTLTVYEDFRCPACKQFEQGDGRSPGYNKTIDKLVDEGKLKVNYHVATIIDSNYPGTKGSKIAGNAAVCANEVGKFKPYHDVLYANQPDERTDGFTKSKVLQLAGQVDGLKSNKKFTSCVNQNRYGTFLKKVQSEFDTRFKSAPSTPSLLLDKKVMLGGNVRQIDPQMASPQIFEQTVDARAKKGSKDAADKPKSSHTGS